MNNSTNNKKNKYYPKLTLDPVSAQNQPYPSPKYYPYPEPKNTFRLNPLVLNTLKNLDVDNLQDVFGKSIQEKRQNSLGEKLQNEKMFKENSEIKEIRASIELAKLNQVRAQQIQQNQMRRIQNLMKDTEADAEVLNKLKLDKIKAKEEEEKKKKERIKAKYLIQQQMKEKEIIKLESKKEYEKDLKDIQNMMDNIKNEDLHNLKEDQRKKAIARQYMETAYAEKEERRRKAKEEERLQKERERQYQQHVVKRENDFNDKKAQIKYEKDKIFEKLCEEETRRQAERDYWENVRNDLHTEQENKKAKLQEIAEKEKMKRQKEEMIESAIHQMKIKEEKKKKEKEMEEEFKKKLIEKFNQDEKLEMLNIQKRKEKEMEMKKEIEKQWKLKLEQYQKQKENELNELQKKKEEDQKNTYLIEQEKKRLLSENEKLLKNFYPTGYHKAITSLKKLPPPLNLDEKSKHDIIFNNIFGNSNPNKASVYPKYGKIKNFVYDRGIQDIHPNINMTNYPMYNSTANNDYDTYPSPEEYKEKMDKIGQINYAYAGGCDTTGIPLRSQMPVFIHNNHNPNKKWITGNQINKTHYINTNNNRTGNRKGYVSYLGSLKNLNNVKDFNNDYKEANRSTKMFSNTDASFYQRQKSFSPFNRNITIESTNPNGIHCPENYQQTIKTRIATQV
jgi:hypothetical protein